jgi:hypothetical protein
MKLLLLGAMASLLLPDVSTAQTRSTDPRRVETYRSVAIDAAGGLVITTSDQKTILVPKESGQSSFSEPIVSSARTAVGAQAEFPNCCTSYDIPLQLVIHANGKVHRFTGIGLPIFHWHFADGGTRVAFGQEPVHFGCSIHYELRDIQSERLIDSADIPEPCGQILEPRAVQIPKWVTDLHSERK